MPLIHYVNFQALNFSLLKKKAKLHMQRNTNYEYDLFLTGVHIYYINQQLCII